MEYLENKKLSIKRFLVLFYVVAFSISCHSTKIVLNTCDARYIDMFLDAYYYSRYDYPNNVDEFVFFLNHFNFIEEYYEFYKNLDMELENVYKEKDNMLIYKEKGILFVKHKDSIILELEMRDACDELMSMNFRFYLRNPLFLNKYEIPNNREDSVFLKFMEKQGEVRKKYTSIIEEDSNDANSPYKLVMLKYEKEKGITDFCNSGVDFSKYPFFKDLELCFYEFCNNHGIETIICTTAIFYN